MLAQADLQNALAQALGEFGPAWKIVSDCSAVDPLDPSHWAVGSQSFHVNLRHRVTGRLKVLGRRVADEPSASLHRAVALSLVDAYVHGNPDPMRRYLEDIGVAPSTERDAGHFFRRPLAVAAGPSPPREVAEVSVAPAPVAPTLIPTAAPPRPAVSVAPLGSSVVMATGPGGRRILRRFKREFEIWQWRRATGSSDQRTTSRGD